jgi:hypothetical protein
VLRLAKLVGANPTSAVGICTMFAVSGMILAYGISGSTARRTPLVQQVPARAITPTEVLTTSQKVRRQWSSVECRSRAGTVALDDRRNERQRLVVVLIEVSRATLFS